MLMFSHRLRKQRKNLQIVAIALFCILCSIDMTGAEPLPDILILNSYHQGEDWSDNEIAGILRLPQKDLSLPGSRH